MLTCGMTTMGTPSIDDGEALGLHGRVSNIPGSNVHTGGRWNEGEYLISVEGEVRETAVSGENSAVAATHRGGTWSRQDLN